MILPIMLIGQFRYANAQEQKIAYTNIELILNFMPEAKAIEEKLQKYQAKLSDVLMQKDSVLQVEYRAFVEAKQAGKLTPEQEQAKVKKLTAMDAEVQELAKKSDEKLMDKRIELLQPLQEKVQEIINEIAKEKGYTYVINQGMTSTTILYGVEQHDITEDLAKRLGIELPKEEETE